MSCFHTPSYCRARHLLRSAPCMIMAIQLFVPVPEHNLLKYNIRLCRAAQLCNLLQPWGPSVATTCGRWPAEPMTPRLYSMRFGVPSSSRGLLITSGVEELVMACATSAGVAVGWVSRYTAIMPVTCGAACAPTWVNVSGSRGGNGGGSSE